MELCCNFSQKGGGGHPNFHKMIFYGLITFLWLDKSLWLDNLLVGWIIFLLPNKFLWQDNFCIGQMTYL